MTGTGIGGTGGKKFEENFMYSSSSGSARTELYNQS
jgi:hypothetical protein